MEGEDIDSESLQAVRNLKSKFEKLAMETQAAPRINTNGDTLAATAPSSPRPRATSSSQLNAPPAEGFHLRTSSSSSDLSVSTKRAPPPPPPPRGSKFLSPSPTHSPAASPLLRPVPPPPILAQDANSPSSVAALKDIFASTPPSRIQSPRQSLIETKPLIPPRPGSTAQRTTSPDQPRPFSGDAPILAKESANVSALKDIFASSPPSRIQSPRQSLIETKPIIPPRPSSIAQITTNPEQTRPFSDDAPILAKDINSPPNVSALKDIFANSQPSRIQSPRQSLIETRPVIPPRPGSIAQRTTSPEQTSPFSEDDTQSSDSLPPPIPSRPQPFASNSIRSLATTLDDSTKTGDDIQASPRSMIPPPRPPPRKHPATSPSKRENGVSSTSLPIPSFASPPPPLPVRRSTIVDPAVAGRPPLPTRSALGVGKLPPPPTRTIALGDKLPPARRPSTPSSDEDSGDEDEQKVQIVDLMPDSSTSSRRPPALGFRDGYSEPKIHVHPHTGCVALSGSHVVVGHQHHIKIYDLAVSEVPSFNLDTKDMGVKDAKVTCMEFRPTISQVDRGFLLWVGTKEGHIFELDIRTGAVRGTKYAAHLHPITHVFRHGRSMISLDESGKTLVFSPDPDNQEDITLLLTMPRVIRTTEKQDFVKMLDGKLWTASRQEHHGAGQRLPTIRIYDVFNPASAGRSVLPIEHVGPVRSATIIPSQPRTVYVGHEEGFISIWELDTDDGFPRCVEVMKVSVSDVLSLEGVNDRLWAGSRNGMISAYDVSQRPWLVTNSWIAHPGLPVKDLIVNHYAITKVGRLCVASVGRDEQLRLWDGLLGFDWVDKELVKLESSFSSFRGLTVLVVSWNCDSARPDSLTGEPENFSFLTDTLHSVDHPPDVIVFGFQEVIDLESRKMVAKNVLLGGKKKGDDGGLSDKVTGAYKRWYDRLIIAVKTAMPKNTPYSVVNTESLVGLFSCIFVKSSERATFDDGAITTIKRGMGGRYGNKGGIVARFVVGDSSFCFINCHLAAGQNAVRQRNADIAGMLEDKSVFSPTEHPLAYVGGGDGSMVLDHEFVIVNGDLNYRIDHRRDAIIACINSGDLPSLLVHDQLLREIKFNQGCRLRGFAEGALTFNPTYKYDPRSNEYDTSEKHRPPAWCDRILWRSRVANRVQPLHYRRYEVNVSDHRPISAAFSLTVKKFDNETREKTKAILQARWVEEQKRLLGVVLGFYVGQAML